MKNLSTSMLASPAHMDDDFHKDAVMMEANLTSILASVGSAVDGEFSSIELLFSSSDLNNLSRWMNLSIENLTEHILRATQQSMMSSHHGSRDPLHLVATITACYFLIFFAGVLGNLITCTVISRNKSMHTATNYYLFNLAISDLILLLSGMPLDLFNIWYPMSYPFSDAVCILQGLMSETSANATVLTITAFTVERYIAICHPFRQHTMSKLSRAVKFILAIWLTAFTLAVPQAMQFGVINVGKGGKTCTIKNDYILHVFALSGFVFFVGPMTAICVLYVLIGVKLKKSKLLQGVKRKTSAEPTRGSMSGQHRVIRMLVAVAVAFFLCWAPFHAQRLMAVYGSAVKVSPSDTYYSIYSALTYISGVLYFLSTCINPLLYNIMSYKFRDAFKATIARQCGMGSKYQVRSHNYSALSRHNGSLRMTNTTMVNRRLSSSQDSSKPRRSHLRSISGSSQSTFLTSLSKTDVFSTQLSNRGEYQIAETETDRVDDHRSQQQQHHHQAHSTRNIVFPEQSESFGRQRNSLPASPAELQMRAMPTILGSDKNPRSQHLPAKYLPKQRSFQHTRNLAKLRTDFCENHYHHNNNTAGITTTGIHSPEQSPSRGSPSSTAEEANAAKQTTNTPFHRRRSSSHQPSTLETISEKLRRGTRKVFSFGTNSNGNSATTSSATSVVMQPSRTTENTNISS